jgi:hypothetical protein
MQIIVATWIYEVNLREWRVSGLERYLAAEMGNICHAIISILMFSKILRPKTKFTTNIFSFTCEKCVLCLNLNSLSKLFGIRSVTIRDPGRPPQSRAGSLNHVCLQSPRLLAPHALISILSPPLW